MIDRTRRWRAGGAALALVAALAVLSATPGVAHADAPPGATFYVTSRVATLTTADGEPINVTIISTVVNLDFSDELRTTAIEPSSITVTVGGVALDWTKHAFTFNHQRLTVTNEEWREGAVTEAELQQRRTSVVSVSYVQPADAGDERLRYATGSDVGSFEVTATLTSEEGASASFVVPAEPKTVTATIRGNGSPQISQTVTLEPAGARDADTSAPTGQDVGDIVRRICEQLGGNCQ